MIFHHSSPPPATTLSNSRTPLTLTALRAQKAPPRRHRRRSFIKKVFNFNFILSACTARACNLSEINYNRARRQKAAVRISLKASRRRTKTTPAAEIAL
jgi:hypothetical protein